MSNRLATALWATATVVAFVPVTPAPVAGQSQTAETAASTPPRTGWGQPDLRGMWDFRTLTPLQRPGRMADKEFLTDEEAALFVQRTLQERDKDRRYENARLDVEFAYNQFWWDYGTTITDDKRTSLIVDPPDGRIPDLTPEAQERARAPRQRPVTERVVLGSVAHGPEDVGLSERCLLGFSSGPPIVPSEYNNILQLFQTPDHVVIFTEMIHEARIVPLDGRAHLPGAVPQWLGDSRGHWEGDTLVVDTTNFTDKASFNGGLVGRGASGETFHLIERFTRVNADTLLYEFTVEDPTWWAQPWTAAIPMKTTEGPIFEYACNEGNYGMANLLTGARIQEQ